MQVKFLPLNFSAASLSHFKFSKSRNMRKNDYIFMKFSHIYSRWCLFSGWACLTPRLLPAHTQSYSCSLVLMNPSESQLPFLSALSWSCAMSFCNVRRIGSYTAESGNPPTTTLDILPPLEAIRCQKHFLPCHIYTAGMAVRNPHVARDHTTIWTVLPSLVAWTTFAKGQC